MRRLRAPPPLHPDAHRRRRLRRRLGPVHIAREDTLIPIPDSLPFDQAAIIPDAVSTPYAAVVAPRASGPPIRGRVGRGRSRRPNVRLARLVGAAPIIAVDPLPAPGTARSAFGADLALDPAAPDFADR